jgi:Phosphotransferase enzyme family
MPRDDADWLDLWQRSKGAIVRVAAASALLAPAAIGAQLAGAAACAWLEADDAAGALALLGIRARPLAITRLTGGRSNAVYRVHLPDRTVILKRALPAGTLLAFAARWVGPQPFARDVSANGRICREARALETLAAAGVRVPRLLAVNPAAGLILVEDIAGEPLSATLARPGAATRIAAYGRAIAAAHAAGVTLSDGHPGNALVDRDGEVTLIDLEFAEHACDLGDDFARRCAFDLAYAAQYFTAQERRVFLAAAGAGPSVTGEAARLDEYAMMFVAEQRRQRSIARAA